MSDKVPGTLSLWGVGFWIAWLVAAVPSVASAQGPDWLALDATACPAASVQGLAESVARLAPAEGFAGRAEVRIGAVDGGERLQLDVRVVDAVGEVLVERAVRVASCDEGVEAASIIVALALRPEVEVGGEVEVAGVAAPPVAPPPVAAARRPRVVRESGWQLAVAEPEPRPTVFGLTARLVGVQGALPGIHGGGELGVAYRVRTWRIEAGLGYVAPADAREPRSGGAARIDLLAGSTRGCTTAAAPLVVCLGVELGAMRAEGHELPTSRNGTGRWSAGRLEVRGEWGSNPVDLAVGLGLVVPIDPPRFVIDGAGTVHQPSWIGLQAFLALHWWIL